MLKSPETYQGKQVIINSDRLIFNAREDSLFSSNKTIAFSTNKDFHINTSEGSDGKFAVNSPKIHLGKIKANNSLADNPAVKGQELEQLLNDILNHLNLLYSTVLPLLNQITLFPGLPTVPSPTNIGIISPLISDLNVLKGKIKSIKSSNVYIK
jgi:hypothetical protein|tara:strand:+ start:6403 stop:6864 length:462 start_codon:yes stop_codon:yes gene_type:complete